MNEKNTLIVMRVFIRTKYGQVIRQQYAQSTQTDMFYDRARMLSDANSYAQNEFCGSAYLEKVEFIYGSEEK